MRRLGRRVGEIAEQVQVVQAGERPRQIVFDEPLGASQALETHLDEDAGRVLDVVARGLHETRHLPQLRQHAPRALGERRVVEEDLPGEAGRQQVAVVLGVALPRSNRLELEQPGADVRVERRALDPLGFRQARGIDGRQPPREAAERADLLVDGGAAEILEEVIVEMDAVERRIGGVNLVQPRQILVDEMG